MPAPTLQGTLISLPAELQDSVCEHLALSDLCNLAMACRSHHKPVENCKLRHNSIIATTYKVELDFFGSEYVNGWLLPSTAGLHRMISSFQDGLFPLYATTLPSKKYGIRNGSLRQTARSSSKARQRLVNIYPFMTVRFLRNYHRRFSGYAQWLMRALRVKQPRLQLSLEECYGAIMYWSISDWPG